MAKAAVLLLAHGTPETIEQIPEYLRNVVSGRPLPQTVIEEIQHRYGLIGRSPLTELTLQHAALVEAELAASGHPVKVYVGMRNWKPYIPDVVKQMRADGVEAAAVLCLAPQNSRTSVGLYERAVRAEAGPLRIDFTRGWADHPLLAEAFAERLRAAQAKFTAETGAPVPVLFTAHSVPTRTVEPPSAPESGPRMWPAGEGPDPYASDARHTAELVAARVSEIPRWSFAFQSQGASGGPWIGPSVESTLDELAAQGVRNLLLQPIGFLCDHVEILYDIDIAFREYAAKLGIRLERPESLNESPTLARAVAALATTSLTRLQG
ncbi:MAG TPA: ferrochelatase [Terracidiphilus sp.]|jgi:ferrochelatase|nr:ferrochelatase [Terracidiphilus sp.]